MEERQQARGSGASDIWGVDHSFYKAIISKHNEQLPIARKGF
jgi:hypothetical protein